LPEGEGLWKSQVQEGVIQGFGVGDKRFGKATTTAGSSRLLTHVWYVG
jgi:hypothetical protein